MYVHRRNHVQLFAFTLTNPNQCFDGREEALLDFIHTHPNISNLRNNPSAILDTIDEFGRTKDFLMTLGPAKRGIIKSLMAEQRPKVVMDVGAYVGYSALTLGCIFLDLYPGAKGSEVKVFSFEKEPKCAAITSSFVELAGLKGVVDVVVGSADVEFRRLTEEGTLTSVDMLLLDHWEKLYVDDLKVVEELGLLKEGSVIVADNVVCPGAPEYLEYVRGGKASKALLCYTSREIESHMPNGWNVRSHRWHMNVLS